MHGTSAWSDTMNHISQKSKCSNPFRQQRQVMHSKLCVHRHKFLAWLLLAKTPITRSLTGALALERRLPRRHRQHDDGFEPVPLELTVP